MSRILFEISPPRYGAAIFYLDGVVTHTARVHAAAWKKLFDENLRERADRSGAAAPPLSSTICPRWR
ncbi:MAG: hypothetical protein ACM3ZB_09810 [bacterium]